MVHTSLFAGLPGGCGGACWGIDAERLVDLGDASGRVVQVTVVLGSTLDNKNTTVFFVAWLFLAHFFFV